MLIFRVKSVKIYTGQKKFTRVYPWDPWQIWGMGQSGQKWGRQKWPILVSGQNFSSNFWKHITLNFTKYECQCNTITFNVLMRAAYSDIGDAFVKEEPRTLFMKSQNGSLIKDSRYLTLWSQADWKKLNKFC